MNLIDKRGYIINKTNYTTDKLKIIKKDLTVSPVNSYNMTPTNKKYYKIYKETTTKLIVPKYYGLSKINSTIKSTNLNSMISNMTFTKQLNDYQLPCVNKIINTCKTKGGGLLCVPCGFGKCLGIDTPILMYNGIIKPVQYIKKGELIMGDDSQPRHILSICSGFEKMYKIKQLIGDDYIVNESHILTVYINNKLVDIELKECLKLQTNIYGYHEIIYFNETYIHNISSFVQYHTHGRLPRLYKCNSIQNRIKLLQEYIKYYVLNNILIVNCNILKLDLLFVFRSIGLFPIVTEDGLDISNITFKNMSFVQNNKSYLKNKINIIELPENKYYGFEIDGNKRFVLGDCTVTHNTVVALYIACALKSKTLVVVHKEFLVNQWKERIEQFTDASVGVLQGKKIDVENKDIVIGMLQSISKFKYGPEILNQFQFVIYDECHHTSAEKFSQALFLLNSKYQLGLSATPTRKDGLTKVFKWFLGDIIYQVKRKLNTDLIVKRYISTSDTEYYKEQYNVCNKPSPATMINKVVQYENRNVFIINLLNNLINEKRNLLVLSERRGHLEKIKEDLLTKFDIDAGLYIGGMKPADLDLSCEKQIILATYQMASEGFDCKKLNTLVMITSKSDIIQSVGRILRKEHESVKPLIIDICDMYSIYSNQSRKRLKYYEQNKYNITNINIHNFEKIKEQSKLKMTKQTNEDLNKCMFDDDDD